MTEPTAQFAPFELIPTILLIPEPVNTGLKKVKNNYESNNNNNNNNNNKDDDNIDEVQPKRALKPLDRATGVAIITFVRRRKDSIEKSKNTPKSSSSNPYGDNKMITDGNKKRHKSTFYKGEDDTKVVDNLTASLAIISSMADKIGIISDKDVKAINKKFLMDSNVTIYNLIVDCQVSIIDLHLAGILPEFQDLLDLKFLLTDLTIGKRELFNADKLVTFFHVDYASLRERDDFSFSIIDIIEADFYANELMTLEFTFEYVMSHKYMERQQLRELNIGLDGLKLLGFEKSYMKPLRISENFALTKLKWSREEYTNFMSQ